MSEQLHVVNNKFKYVLNMRQKIIWFAYEP